MLPLKELWLPLPDWAKQGAFPVILTALLAAFGLGMRKMIDWMIRRSREKRYGRILDSFDVLPTPRYCPMQFSFGKTSDDIATITGLKLSEVESDLRELEKQNRVYRSMDCWCRGQPPSPPIHISTSSF